MERPPAEACSSPLLPLRWQDPEAVEALQAALRRPEPQAAPRLLLLDRGVVGGHPPPDALRPLLSSREHQRLAAFRRPEDQHRFLLGRGCLRLILGRLLARDPARLPLIVGSHGKPALADAGGPCFNLSHGGDLILLAFHPLRPVGVDVEGLRPSLDWRPIARRVLTPQECEALERRCGTDPSGGSRAFLLAWCALEARLKARGDGFAGLERLQRQDQGAAEPAEVVWQVRLPGAHVGAVALAPPA